MQWISKLLIKMYYKPMKCLSSVLAILSEPWKMRRAVGCHSQSSDSDIRLNVYSVSRNGREELLFSFWLSPFIFSVCTCHRVCEEGRGQLVGVSVLPLRGAQGWDEGCHIWWQAPLLSDLTSQGLSSLRSLLGIETIPTILEAAFVASVTIYMLCSAMIYISSLDPKEMQRCAQNHPPEIIVNNRNWKPKPTRVVWMK